MQERWEVVVVRGWSDGAHLRVRLLRAGPSGATGAVAVSSATAAGDQLATWLAELGAGDGGVDAGETPPQTPRGRQRPHPSDGRGTPAS